MNARELSSLLDSRGVELSLTDDGRLRYRAPAGVLTPALVGEIRRHRERLQTGLTASRATPLTAAQTRMWLAERRSGPSPAYVIGGAFRVRGPLDRERFRQALRLVVDRQPALRTWIRDGDGPPAAVVDATVPVELPVVRVGPAEDRVLRQLITDELAKPIDLSVAPLFRARLLELAPDEHVGILAIHHIVSDDYSVQLLSQQVLDGYAELAAGSRPAPPVAAPSAPRAPYPDGVIARRRAELAGTPQQRLPAPDAATGEAAWMAASRLIRLDGPAWQRWEAARRRSGTTTLALALALTGIAVAAAGGQRDLLIGVPDFGRERQEDWQTIGYYATTLLVRVRIDRTATFARLVADIGAELIAAQRVKGVPYEEIAGTRAGSAVGGCVLWLAPYSERPSTAPPGLSVEPVRTVVDAARHDLRLGLFTRPDRLELTVTHRPGQVATNFADRLYRSVAHLHHNIPEPAEPVADAVSHARSAPDPAAGNQEAPMFQQADRALLASVQASRRAARTPVRSDRDALVEVMLPPPAPWQPATVRAMLPGLDLCDWVDENLTRVRALIAEHAAVLLRGFTHRPADLGECVTRIAGAPLLDYVNRSTPRDRVEGRVFTSTDYPPDQTIPLHSEQSYTTRWPLVLGFGCVVPAASGGQTPLARTADVLAAVPTDLVSRFDEHGLRYERWYQPHLDLSWQEVFQTGDPDEVDRYCATAGIVTEWHGPDVLRTVQHAQATTVHPATGQRIWFNQAHLFHPAALPDYARAALGAAAHPPRGVCFGDGTPIPDQDVHAISAVLDRLSWQFDWQRDDVVVLDNVATLHGRRPYRGDRRVLVAMAGEGS